MLFSALSSSALISLAAGASIPSTNGFPNPNPQQMMAIAMQAGGLLPNGALPKSLGAGSTTAFQLITANELFETAYFSSLLQNVTSGAQGFQTVDKAAAEKILKTVVAQEQQHAIAATAVLKSAGQWAPTACQYKFPTTDLKSAVSLAETFTAIVLGALQGANVQFAKDGGQGISLIQIISGVIGQEGEQNGAYRLFTKQVPSESPFLTYVPAAFAWSALQMFVVPGSCPYDLKQVNLPIFPPLMANGGAVAMVQPKDQTITFKADLKSSAAGQKYINTNGKGLYLTYSTGQQTPVSVPVSGVEWCGSEITFKADFPYSKTVAQGFTHGALTTSNTFANGDAVVAAALAGPAVIQAQNSI